jgi:two-component system OmpR family response regulator
MHGIVKICVRALALGSVTAHKGAGPDPEQIEMNAGMKALFEPSVLLVEDDEAFADEMSDYLNSHGLRVTRVKTLDGIIDHTRQLGPHLIVLDQFVGDQDSLTILAQLRNHYLGGIVVLTGNDEQVDRVIGLELGADDFVSKAQPPREILARLRAVLRRAASSPEPPALSEPPTTEDKPSQDWCIDTRRREVLAPGGMVVPLTAMEFELLAYLHSRVGEVVSRDELSEAILRRKFSPLDRSLDNLVARIRGALKPFEGERSVIKSVRGAGYVFVGFDAAE